MSISSDYGELNIFSVDYLRITSIVIHVNQHIPRHNQCANGSASASMYNVSSIRGSDTVYMGPFLCHLRQYLRPVPGLNPLSAISCMLYWTHICASTALRQVMYFLPLRHIHLCQFNWWLHALMGAQRMRSLLYLCQNTVFPLTMVSSQNLLRVLHPLNLANPRNWTPAVLIAPTTLQGHLRLIWVLMGALRPENESNPIPWIAQRTVTTHPFTSLSCRRHSSSSTCCAERFPKTVGWAPKMLEVYATQWLICCHSCIPSGI